MINEPIHMLESFSSCIDLIFTSCIDLIFTSQANLITESGVHPSLHPNSHHQIILQYLTWKYIIHHLIFVMPGSNKMQILILVDEQLKCLIETELS